MAGHTVNSAFSLLCCMCFRVLFNMLNLVSHHLQVFHIFLVMLLSGVGSSSVLNSTSLEDQLFQYIDDHQEKFVKVEAAPNVNSASKKCATQPHCSLLGSNSFCITRFTASRVCIG